LGLAALEKRLEKNPIECWELQMSFLVTKYIGVSLSASLGLCGSWFFKFTEPEAADKQEIEGDRTTDR
jgi:hypothetical protein